MVLPMAHLEHSGVLPEPEELRIILAKRSECQEKRKDLRKELEDLALREKVIHQELVEIEASISRYTNFMSALRRVPPEVLSDIFRRSITMVPTARETTRDATPPWNLLLVCKHWHNVCRETSVLWSNILIDSTPPEFPNFNTPPDDDTYWTDDPHGRPLMDVLRAVHSLELQISRSEQSDLYVHIPQRPGFDYAQPLWRVLLPHMHRCVSLKAPFHIVAHTPLVHCTKLRHLKIDCDIDADHYWDRFPVPHPQTPALLEQEKEFIEAITDLPKLLSFSIHVGSGNAQCIDAMDMLKPAYSLVTDLRLQVPKRAHSMVKSMLREMHSLVDLYVEDPYTLLADDGDITSTPAHDPASMKPLYGGTRLTLRHPKKLSVRGPKVVTNVLGNITAPALSELAISGGVAKPDTLLDFLAESACALQCLTLHTPTPSNDVAVLFLASPDLWMALDTLRIHLFEFGPQYTTRWTESGAALFNLLTRYPRILSNHPELDIFPQLISFELAGPKLAPISAIISMLESRRVGNAATNVALLRHCGVAYMAFMHKEDIRKAGSLQWEQALEEQLDQEGRVRDLEQGGLEMCVKRAGEPGDIRLGENEYPPWSWGSPLGL